MAKIIGNVTATPNPRPDWNQADETKADYIKNKPTILTEEDVVELIAANGGGSGSGSVIVQADWDQTDPSKSSYIKNKPDILTESDVVELIAENCEGGADITVDAELSTESANPIQNAAVATFANSVDQSLSLLREDASQALASVDDINAELSETSGRMDTLEESVSQIAELTNDFNEDISNLHVAVDGKADAVHNHDDIYYTEDEIDTKLDSLNDVISSISGGSSDAIIDVFNLPTENIDNGAFYRLFETKWVDNQYICESNTSIIYVDSLPEVGLPAMDIYTRNLVWYYNVSNGIVYSYIDYDLSETAAAEFGYPVPIGWYPCNELYKMTGIFSDIAIINVTTLPEKGLPAFDEPTGGMCLYYNVSEGIVSCYITDTLSELIFAEFGQTVPEAWYPFDMFTGLLGINYGGVIKNIGAADEGASYVLSSYHMYLYNKKWELLMDELSIVQPDWEQNDATQRDYIQNKPTIIGKSGSGAGAEIFNSETNIASGAYSHAEGSGVQAYAESSHAEGYNTKVFVGSKYAHAEGSATVASGEASHAEGGNTRTNGSYSHAEGYNTLADGYYSHAEGYDTEASGEASHAEGSETIASGVYSHAEGEQSTADGEVSHAEGNRSTASGKASHAEGNRSTASGEASHAEGESTIASSKNQHVQGKYNIVDADGLYAHIVGNGNNAADRTNAHTLDWDGNAWFQGNVYIGGTGQDDVVAKRLLTEDDLPTSSLPETTTADNGKLLQVVNGAWTAVSITNGNEVAY